MADEALRNIKMKFEQELRILRENSQKTKQW